MMKVAPKNATLWKNYDCACVGISMGSPNHGGEALEGLLNWVDGNFESCILDVSDTLHRYNYISENCTEAEAAVKARHDGDQWLQDNQALIRAMHIPVQVIRWDHWLQQPVYKENLRLFRQAFELQPEFKSALLTDAASFYLRHGTSMSDITTDELARSTAYLLEELAAHSILYASYSSAAVYPGKQHESFRLVREGKVDGVPRGLEQSCYTRMVIYNFLEAPASGNQHPTLIKTVQN